MGAKNVYTNEQDLEMCRLIAKGKTAKEVAAILKIKYRTVEDRLMELRKKRGAASVAHLMVIMIYRGEIPPDPNELHSFKNQNSMTKDDLNLGKHLEDKIEDIKASMRKVRLHFRIEGPNTRIDSDDLFGFRRLMLDFINPDEYLARAAARLAELEKELAEL